MVMAASRRSSKRPEWAEADAVEVEGIPVEGAENDQDGVVAPAEAREKPFTPADMGAAEI